MTWTAFRHIDVYGFCLEQVGDYASSQRVAAYLWRGVQFFGLGFGSSAVGHTLTKVLVRHPLLHCISA